MSAAPDRLTNDLQASFADHRDNLIASLRESWARGPREKPFDPEWAWWVIKAIVGAITAPSATPQELREQALELAKALGDVRTILDRTINARPDLANQIRWPGSGSRRVARVPPQYFQVRPRRTGQRISFNKLSKAFAP